MSNPFDDDKAEYANPFADAAVTKALNESEADFSTAYSSSAASHPPPYAAVSAPYQPPQHYGTASAPAAASGPSEADMMAIARQKQEQMMREEEAERQRQARQKPTDVEAQQQPQAPLDPNAKNWPRCYPFWRHDIRGEIPVADQKTVRALYYSWMLNTACYLMNMIACMCILISGLEGKSFGWSIMYIVFNLPLSFFTWYRPVYNAFKNDSSMSYTMFFVMGGFHIAWLIYIVIGIQESGCAGFAIAIYMYAYNNGQNKGEAVFVTIAMLLWIVNLGTFALLYVRVRLHYNQRGHTFAEARNQMMTSAAQNPVVQQAATQAATTAATSYVQQQFAKPTGAQSSYSRQVDEE